MKKDTRLHSLKYWRNRANIKQVEMGILIGCTASNYSLKESGKQDIRRSEMLSIQKAINQRLVKDGEPPVTLDDIFLP